jgi:NAD(P)-dependent dehydrogenase (short-subunit alcohol dehydrogenase family)
LTCRGATVLVVGGAKGIGLATTRALAAAGYAPIVWDHDSHALGQLGVAACTMLVALGDRRAVHGALETLRMAGTSLHAVIIVAGVHGTCPAEAMPDDFLEHVLDINFTAHAKLVRDVLPLMAQDSRIVGVSSIAATVGIPMSSAYAASKAALEKFYESLVPELLERRIWPVIIQPGNVNTGFNETGNIYESGCSPFLGRHYQSVLSRIDSRHGMPPEDVAAAILKTVRSVRPRFFNVVGRNAQRAYLATRLLGRNGALQLLLRYFGFK